MKHYLLPVIGIAMAAGLWSCGGQEKPMDLKEAEAQVSAIKKVDPQTLTTAIDSFCYYLGYNEGIAVAANAGVFPQPIAENFHLDDFLIGVTAVLKSDTVTLGYTDGVDHGLKLVDVILRFEENGLKINRDLLLKAMKDRVASPVSDEKADADAEVFRSLAERAQAIMTQNKMVTQNDNTENEE